MSFSSGSRTPSPTGSSSSTIPSPSLATPPQLHQNSIDPAARWLVQKYGGTSVGKFAAQIAEEVVPTYLDQHKLAIVCSARSGTTKALGTTNLLLRAASEALRPSSNATPSAITSGYQTPSYFGRSGAQTPSPPRSSSSPPLATFNGFTSLNSIGPAAFSITVDLIRSEHIKAARELIRSPGLLKELETEIERDCEGLRGYLHAAQIIDEISPRSKDSIVGVGERLACKLVAAVLRDRGVDAEVVSLENIVPPIDELDALEGDDHVLSQEFYDNLSRIVGERIRQCGSRVPVVTGFFGPVPGSLLRQIGRGYTDLLAALLAVGLQASELQIWKEVDGIFTADPRKVPTARLVPIISPEEAAELTYYGSEVIHPFTMDQAIRKKIPIRIKNVENPTGGGTVIHPDPDIETATPDSPETPIAANLNQHARNGSVSSLNQKSRKVPTAVTIKDNIVILNVTSNRKTISHGFLARIFGILDKFGVTVDLISTSEVHVSMAIENLVGRKGIDKLVKELEKTGSVSVHTEMAILSLVGKHMKNMVGIAGRMFTSLADGGVNIEMISQGASEINISCVIDGKDAVKALNLIHQCCLQTLPEGPRGRMGPWLF
ncbi:Aspartokinase [Tulasnella sp. 418]|nr:Aspartokinase [Tulasnella sp. 418]